MLCPSTYSCAFLSAPTDYDGGDCCECTCVYSIHEDRSSYSSCANNFACIDPEAPCVDDDDITIDLPESCDRYSSTFQSVDVDRNVLVWTASVCPANNTRLRGHYPDVVCACVAFHSDQLD